MQYSKPRRYEYESRYGKYRQIMEDTNTWLETFNQSIIPKSDEDIFHIVTEQQKNRLDIIANIYYNNATYYWVLLLANELIDPFTLDVGTIIRVPPLISLYANNGVLNYYGQYYT